MTGGPRSRARPPIRPGRIPGEPAKPGPSSIHRESIRALNLSGTCCLKKGPRVIEAAAAFQSELEFQADQRRSAGAEDDVSGMQFVVIVAIGNVVYVYLQIDMLV